MNDVIAVVTEELIARMALWLHQKVNPELKFYKLKPLKENKTIVIRGSDLELEEEKKNKT